MLMGAHVLLYSDDPEADRAFFRDILGFPHVDVGHGWLIFKLPPAEVAVHPADGEKHGLVHAGHRMLGASLYLMCDDLAAQVKQLKTKSVACTEVEKENWGIRTTIKLPSGGEIGLYQPTHPTALDLPGGGNGTQVSQG
jgi:catechol 2,3-dioxygenase-like lactoylglutathione lyase family enzyme